LLLGSTLWLDLFARRAPDFWSIRSNEFCEDLPQQHLPPLPLERFLEALRACSCPPDAPLSEVYRTFATIENPEPEEFVLNTLLRDPWKRLGEAIHEVHRGDLEVAATSLGAVRSELETITKDPGFSPGELHLFACHRARVYASYVAFHQQAPRVALKILQENKDASLYAEASASLFQLCNLQSQQVRSLYLSEMGIHFSFDLGKKLAEMEEESAEPQIWERIAQLFQARGSFDNVLQIYQDKLVPLYQRLGDVREEAIIWGQIGDILVARGKPDEALKIREEKELPVYQRLGDVHLEAVTWGQIGDIYQVQGKLDEALKIREEKQLPVYQRLGAVRSEAITWGKIGDILEARGKLNEAVAIRQEKELPIFQHLGDVREEALTWGKICDILEERGKLEEALKIRQEKELPVFQRLGARRELLVAQTNLALTYLKRAQGGDREQARALLQEALQSAEDMGLPEAEKIRETLRGVGL
jgi:tetratricopeptide (TPR) repeat protein